MLAVGPNGAGKTNLLESLHVGTQGFSPRTRADGELIRFGAEAARVALQARRGDAALEVEVVLRLHNAKQTRLNGAPLRSAEQLRSEGATLVFTPDRLAIVKGGPAVRRAYFDRALGRLMPARATLSVEYGAAVGQRNAALRRVAAGFSSLDAVAPWTQRVANVGTALVEARRDLVGLLASPVAECAGELGLADVRLAYEGDSPTTDALEDRIQRDLERGSTGLGPHLHDFELVSAGRDLRTFGSQGEQRLAVLALLLGEAQLLLERSGVPPLLLLDDVLSELDPERRRVLAERVAVAGQAFVTSTTASALRVEPAQLLEISPGSAKART